MKSVLFLLFSLLFCSTVYSQNALDKFDPKETLTPEKCYDVIKTAWDGLKKISEEYETQTAVKSEFETTAEFNTRVRKAKDEFINKVQKFSNDNNLAQKEFSVWMKADLTKYDADKEVYSINSPSEILVQPKKPDIEITCPSNKYVTLTEKNEKGYRRAFIHLSTDPNFSWYVNKVTAQAAKNKESHIFFKLNFTFKAWVNEVHNQIVLEVVPHKLALMDQSENFIYWSEEIF